jgi:hypothetical protein
MRLKQSNLKAAPQKGLLFIREEKMKIIFIAIGLMTVLLFICFSRSLACSFDSDCAGNSKCVKTSGLIFGVCSGGSIPGNTSKPVYSSVNLDSTHEKTCASDADCGASNKCVKYRGNISGVCMKRK